MKIKVLIPGKVLVSGEHSVVYGEPAIVAAIDRKMEIMLEESTKYELISDNEDKMGLVQFALEKSGMKLEKVKMTINSNIPPGMGSSAALCAGIIKAAYRYQGKRISDKAWHQLTWECEKKAHWNSSGVDPAAVIYGGLLWYVRGKELEQLKILKSYSLVLVDSGKPEESTGEMVSDLANRIKNQDSRFKNLITKTGEVTVRLRRQMERGGEIGDLVNENGLLLEELGLVGERAKNISTILRNKGYGVKITGAGGVKKGSGRLMVWGGSLETIKTLGYEAFAVTIGGK